MRRLDKYIPVLEPHLGRIQFLCLYLAGAVIFLFLVLGSKFEYTISPIYRLCMLGSCVLFTLSAAVQMHKRKTRYPSRPAVMMVIWFMFTLLVQFAGGSVSHHYTLLPPVYLLAFPFAAITRDETNQTGLKVMALVIVSAMLVWVLNTILLVADCLPAFLRNHVGWEGTRLNAFFHSNICARGFMLGIAFSLGLCFQFPQKWAKALLLTAAALMFAALSLTNSRSVILITGLLVAGTAFFMIFKGNSRRFLAALVAAMVTMVSLLLVSQALFRWNSDRLTAQQPALEVPVQQNIARQINDRTAVQPSYRVLLLSGGDARQEETPGNSTLQSKSVPAVLLSGTTEAAPEAAESSSGYSKQKSFVTDLPSLNNRTIIWSAALQRIQEKPSILLWGTDNTELIIGGVSVPHTHNSWLEVLLRLGIPGFLLSLVFSGQALWSSVVLLWKRQVDLWQKIISLLVLCILISSFFEPSLFFSAYSWHFVDFIFFLCLGYLIQWRKHVSSGKSDSESCMTTI